MAALERAFALAKMDDIAVLIGQELKLDVACPLDPLFQIQAVVAKGRPRLSARTRKRPGHPFQRVDDPHPLAAPAGRRLDEQRESQPAGGHQQLLIGQWIIGARDDRHAGRLHPAAGRGLVPRQP